MNLTRRSYQKELLDQESIPLADIKQNMRELNFINTWLGGHDITVKAVKQFGKYKKLSVCEIGCGGGDNLLAIDAWCKAQGIQLSATGIDIKQECIVFAKSRSDFFGVINWITSDYQKVIFETKPDIIFSSLFCHHFTQDELVEQFVWMKSNSLYGFFVNDLQRNKAAYYLIKMLTGIFSKSYLVKNDAPLSVARGFHKDELQTICSLANIEGCSIHWKWAFRYLLTYTHGH